MPHYLDFITPTKRSVETCLTETGHEIAGALSHALRERPQFIEIIMAYGMIGTGLDQTLDSTELTAETLAINEGRRQMALDILSVLKLAQMDHDDVVEYGKEFGLIEGNIEP